MKEIPPRMYLYFETLSVKMPKLTKCDDKARYIKISFETFHCPPWPWNERSTRRSSDFLSWRLL